MSQAASERFKYLVAASIKRDMAEVIGWEFAMWRDGRELLSMCSGFARAPWEATNPSAHSSPNRPLLTASISKMITGWALMLAISDWNRVLDTAPAVYSELRHLPPPHPPFSPGQSWPANVFEALPKIQPQFRIMLRDLVAQRTGLSHAVVERVFQKPSRLSLDSGLAGLLSRHLSGVALPPNVDKITLRHCLTHTTLINWEVINNPNPYDMQRDVGMNWTETGKNLTFLRRIFSTALNGVPGTASKPEYDGNNSGLVRYAIEECIAGDTPEAYEQYIKRRVFEPLGSSGVSCASPGDTLYYEGDPFPAGADPNSVPKPGILYPPCTRTACAGGWFASARDLAKWLDATRGKDLGKEWLKTDEWLGLGITSTGWVLLSGVPAGTLWHNGKGPGASAMLVMLPNGVVVALMANSNVYSADTATQRALAAVQPVIEFPPPHVQGGVKIKNPLRYGDIWYTLNGSNPTPNAAGSTRYTSEIPQSNNMRVRASVWENGALITGPMEAFGGAS